ncbi:unnamed protein product [Polarella glacialis]|uniref:Uncharacterized protein n=1 Tax=Polarella glacialis TaxID=89957 RepID=A0A813E0H4_POLGL|nr:unnamed protein product [Polarella glacialis]
MQGRPTYWQASGEYFMYHCQGFNKWRIAAISAFGSNMNGKCFAFVSDSRPNRDIMDASLLKGWIEVENGEWIVREDAGVVSVGRLGDQMEIEEVEEAVDSQCAAGSEDGSSSEEASSKKSKCPVMPVVRKVKAKVVEGAKAAGNWARRLFPKFLGSPDEEDTIPDVDAQQSAIEDTVDTDDGCQAETKHQIGCSFTQKFYIEKQEKSTAEQRKMELNRLTKLQGVAMKPDAQTWLKARLHILRRLNKRDNLM